MFMWENVVICNLFVNVFIHNPSSMIHQTSICYNVLRLVLMVIFVLIDIMLWFITVCEFFPLKPKTCCYFIFRMLVDLYSVMVDSVLAGIKHYSQTLSVHKVRLEDETVVLKGWKCSTKPMIAVVVLSKVTHCRLIKGEWQREGRSIPWGLPPLGIDRWRREEICVKQFYAEEHRETMNYESLLWV